MSLTARSLTTHEMAVEAALSRLQRRWAREGKVPFDAQLDVVAALLPLMLDMAVMDTADIFVKLPPPSIMADASPLGLLAQAVLGPSIRSRLAVRASAIADELTKGYTPATVARNEVAGVRTAATSAVATYAAPYVTAEVVWHSSPDCVHRACLDMDGERVAYGQPFSNGASGPPVHRSCKCRTALEITPLSVTAGGALTAAAEGPGWLAVVAIEGLETPDHRMVEKGGLGWRTLPLPLTWAPNSDDHENDVVVGQITEVWREGDEVRARGVWDTSPDAIEVRRKVDNQMLRWVSMCPDTPRSWEVRMSPGCDEATQGVDPTLDGPPVGQDLGACVMTEVYLDMDFAKLTVVDHPAWPGSVIVSGDAQIPPLTDRGRVAATPPDQSPVPTPQSPALALVASVTSAELSPTWWFHRANLPPSSWFDDPEFTSYAPVTITDEGRIFGHFAPDVEHVSGYGRPPRGADFSDARFHVRRQPTRDGKVIEAGLIVGGVGHAPAGLTIAQAQQYYAGGPGALEVGRIRVGMDAHGMWGSGMVNPALDDDQIYQAATLGFSVDYRRPQFGVGPWQLIAISSGILVEGYSKARESLVACGSETRLLLIGEPVTQDVLISG